MATIKRVWITAQPMQVGDPLPEVWVSLSDGTEKMLFTYYPDEIAESPRRKYIEVVPVVEDVASGHDGYSDAAMGLAGWLLAQRFRPDRPGWRLQWAVRSHLPKGT